MNMQTKKSTSLNNQPYDAKMNAKIEEIAAAHNINLHKGVYASVVGPQLETRAEYRYLKIIGADAVGMSTVPEIIVANHLQIPVIALSVLTCLLYTSDAADE